MNCLALSRAAAMSDIIRSKVLTLFRRASSFQTVTWLESVMPTRK
jgi:hypothetical protein